MQCLMFGYVWHERNIMLRFLRYSIIHRRVGCLTHDSSCISKCTDGEGEVLPYELHHGMGIFEKELLRSNPNSKRKSHYHQCGCNLWMPYASRESCARWVVSLPISEQVPCLWFKGHCSNMELIRSHLSTIPQLYAQVLTVGLLADWS